jgi:hypothetical protein
VLRAKIILGALLALASAGSSAQAAWRCGNNYSQQPCAGGTALAAPAAAPSAAEGKQAAAGAKADAQRADAMEKARLAQEKNAPKAIVIASPEPAEPVAAKKDGKKPKGGKPEEFRAVAPGTGKKPEKKKP